MSSRHSVSSVAAPSPADLIAARSALSMQARDGLLMEGAALGAVAAEVGTPCWVYGAGTLVGRYRALAAALRPVGARIHYALKANDHLAIVAALAREGAGADVVSGGELARALRAGMAAAHVVFSGVGKSRVELEQALLAGIGQINVESAAELDMVAAVARGLGRVAAVALRINPDVDAATHDKISTGRAGDKFGIALGDAAGLYRRAAADPALEPVGLALHIGSQVASMGPFREAYRRTASLVGGLRTEGLSVRRIDCGGGLGIRYRDEPAVSPDAFAAVLEETLGTLGVELMVEPGRWLVGPAGVLLARVVLVKHGPAAGEAAAHRFVVLDAAMNDLARPALYDAWHGIVPVSPLLADAALSAADVVGPVCESSDFFARGRMLPALAEGDLVAVLDAGAYGAVMSSTYNARPLAAQVLVDGERWEIIRARQTVAELWRGETVPQWLGEAPRP